MLPSRDPQRELLGFTNSESFGLFVEGLRALQCYGSESDRDQPDKTRLGWFIGQAVARLRENVKRYPDDLLPRYYLGVATTTLNQHFYTKIVAGMKDKLIGLGRHCVFSENPALAKEEERMQARRDAEEVLSLDGEPWPLLHEANGQLRYLQDRLEENRDQPGPSATALSQLLAAAVFNRAEIYARLGREDDTRVALNLLNLDIWKLSASPAPWTTRWFPSASQEDTEIEEADALETQRKILQYSLEARRAIRRANVNDLRAALDRLQPQPRHSRVAEDASLEPPSDLFSRKAKGSRHAVDAQADYWTKLGYVRYELAISRNADLLAVLWPNFPPGHGCEQGLTQVETALREVLNLKANWNPAQIYLALAYRVHVGVADALGNLSDKDRYEKKSARLFASLLGSDEVSSEDLSGRWKVSGNVNVSPASEKPAEAPAKPRE